MAQQSDIVSQILATLAASDPDLDTSVGTTTRKIIDAVSEQISEAYVDNHVLAYQYDIDSKVGGDLDGFCALFGIQRFGAKRATGVVTFTRSASSASSVALIPVNTTVGSPDTLNTEVQTVAPGFMTINQTSVSVPVIAIQGGPQGNIGAGLLSQVLTPLPQVLSVTNLSPLSGGTEAESDSALRLRFKTTVFRSLAGTEQMYLGIALDDAQANAGVGCYAANVVGSSKRHREQIQIDTGSATSVIDDAFYVYPSSPVVGPDIDGGIVLVHNLDYTFDTTSNPPVVTMLTDTYWDGTYTDSGDRNLVDTEGAILDLDFEYAPDATRNDPGANINNRIDVYCAGSRPQSATQSIIFQSITEFTSDDTSVYYVGNFFRKDGSQPLDGNVFIPLAFGPIETLPSSIVIGSTTFLEGSDYWLIHQDIPFGLTPSSLFGLEWDATNLPSGTNPPFSIDYTYNEVPTAVQKLIDRWRLLGTDAKAHQAKEINLRFNLAIMYDRGVDRTVTNAAIRTALSKFMAGIGFNGVIQVSDVLNVIHNVQGVDNVRFMHDSDTDYATGSRAAYHIAIQQIGPTGAVQNTFCDSSGRPIDVEFGDAEVAVFHSIAGKSATEPLPKAQNTFGSV